MKLLKDETDSNRNLKPNPMKADARIALRNVDNSPPPLKKSVTTIVGTSSSNASAPSGPVASSTPTPPPKTISGGVLNGKAVSLPKPAYPQVARAAKASGSVVVQVTVDESGNVISANVVSGHPLLKASAVNAASQSKFSPTMLSGKPVKMTGTIVYNFASDGSAVAASNNVGQTANATPQPLSPEDEKRQAILNKLHPAIYALIERVKAKQIQAAQDEIKFVTNGKAEIQVWLKDKSPQAIEELKQLGFEIILDPQFSRMVIGRVAIEKLEALSELKSVRYITPQMK